MTTAPRAAFIAAAAIAIVFASVHRTDTAAAQDPAQRSAFPGGPMFKTYCATCHGAGGKGDGPFAASMRKRPPDLTQLTKLNNGTFPTEHVTKTIDGRDSKAPHGPSDMPVWGDAFSRTTQDSDAESVRLKIEALVEYVKSIQERPAAQ